MTFVDIVYHSHYTSEILLTLYYINKCHSHLTAELRYTISTGHSHYTAEILPTLCYINKCHSHYTSSNISAV
jgi:hypothetical protein